MRKRLFAAALMLGTALSSAADARSFVVAIPANMSPATQEAAEGFFAKVFNRLQPGDMLTVIDATLSVEVQQAQVRQIVKIHLENANELRLRP